MIWEDMWEQMWLYGNPLSPLCTIFYQFIKKPNYILREDSIIDAMRILIQTPSTRVSCNQAVLSFQYHRAFSVSVVGFRMMIPCSTHFNTHHPFQHAAENAALLVLFSQRMPSA